MSFPIYQPVGDRAVLISYEERIDPRINERVRFLSKVIKEHRFPWVEEVVFSYRSVLIIYHPQSIHFLKVVEAIQKIEQGLTLPPSARPDVYEIPTVYGGSYGPDLNRVSQVSGLSSKDIVEIYSSTLFTIYFLGFLCAQPYLGGLPERLQIPRLDNPRLHMAAGSVGIGGIQASLLTIDQPSGHHFIGRTFLCLYNPEKNPPTSLRAGDRLVFKPIREEEIPDSMGKEPVKKGNEIP